MHDELAVFQTPQGWCAMLGRGEVLRALTFGHRRRAIGHRLAERRRGLQRAAVVVEPGIGGAYFGRIGGRAK